MWLCVSLLGTAGCSFKVSHLQSKHPCGFLDCGPDEAQIDQCPAVVQKDKADRPGVSLTGSKTPGATHAYRPSSKSRNMPLVHIIFSKSLIIIVAEGQFMHKSIYIDNQCPVFNFPEVICSNDSQISDTAKSHQRYPLHNDAYCSPQ